MIPGIQIDESFKYKLDVLSSETKEFEIIEEMYFKTSMKPYDEKNHFLSAIFQVLPVQNEQVGDHAGNLMLLHGTSVTRAEQILKLGYINSTKGWYGGGCTYLSENSWDCLGYARRSEERDRTEAGDHFLIFLNETLNIDELVEVPRKVVSKKNPLKDKTEPPDDRFSKFIRDKNPKVDKKNDYREDKLGRLYRKVEIKRQGEEFTAPADDVIPRYLLQIKLSKEHQKELY